MLGAIVGDIVGSRFEWNNIKTKEFKLFTPNCFATDDSVMSLALAKAVLLCDGKLEKLGKLAVSCMQEVGRFYPHCGYGGMFKQWMFSNNPKPYGSYGNGSAMRVSACGHAAKTFDDAIRFARAVTEVTHDHPEGMKGAESTTAAIFMAKSGSTLSEIRDYIDKNYYPMDFTLDGIRHTYRFEESCQKTVPQVMMAFFESTSFEDAIRNAISIGGDSDTLAAITGGMAEAFYGIPTEIRSSAMPYLDKRLTKILLDFESVFLPKTEKN